MNAPEPGQSAVVVEVAAAEPLVGHWRRRHDLVANRGMPAHVTALFPFRPPSVIARAELQQLADLAAHTPRHRYALASIDEFPGVIFLRLFPDDWFRQLTHTLLEAFPDCPPYGGAYPDIVPHLTIAQLKGGESQSALRALIDNAMAASLPVACEATALSLFISDAEGHWQVAHRFPFHE